MITYDEQVSEHKYPSVDTELPKLDGDEFMIYYLKVRVS